jgi:hypothetical protein
MTMADDGVRLSFLIAVEFRDSIAEVHQTHATILAAILVPIAIAPVDIVPGHADTLASW